MIKQTYSDIVTPELLQGNIDNNEYRGFLEDYRVIHCLLRKYKPKSIFEVGCNEGRGTLIMCNAVPDAKVYSLDLPDELHHLTKQHPISEGKKSPVGHLCNRPFTLLRGDSMTFDYSQYPCEAYFIDGEHDYMHPFTETMKIGFLKPNLIIWHDSDIPEVENAIIDGIKYCLTANIRYSVYRVEGTRIAYALKKGK